MVITLLHLLDWAIIAVSFFNTVALLWLGLTVLLNAERRTWGTWAAGGGLLLGGLFFVGHSAVVGRDIFTITEEAELWWRVAWLPFIGGPYMWYLVIAWYAGVLPAGRHRAWLAAVTALGLAALALLAFADPLPSFGQVVYERAPDWGPAPAALAMGMPAAVLIYPVYSVLCVVLALLALRHPEASARFMGDLARHRARPWLIAASLALLAVSLSVGAAAAWFLLQAYAGRLPDLSLRALALVISFDLLISSLIALVTVLAGQAIVAYEIFTGKTLPRGGLRRHWRRSLVLAAGYGALVGGSLALPVPLDPIWRLLLATVLMTLFFALLSWRSYIDRDQSMARLRPFVASQHLYERILRPAAPPTLAEAAAPLRALCDDVLGATTARLLPLGPLAPLVPPLAHSEQRSTINDQRSTTNDQRRPNTEASRSPALSAQLSALSAQPFSPDTLCLPLDPAQHGGAAWAVPLWSERGLIGALLLGPKRDGGLYTQEEIELARAAGERLIDTAASAEMARRLMDLQRQRLAESQVIDRRTRRVLHDDVLPKIHEVMLTIADCRLQIADVEITPTNLLSSIFYLQSQADQVIASLADVHRQIADLLHAMPATTAPEVARLGLVGALRRAVDDELAGAFERVDWDIPPEAEEAARHLPPLAAEVTFYAAREAVRNAARHGRAGSDSRPLHLTLAARATPAGLTLHIEDDGVGIGASSAAGGAGRGLDLHSTMLAVVGGALTVESLPGAFTRVSLVLPSS
ncbi:MAG TPA: ATP-binding protein [Roseiflexaceae bacterium]|nr:ATP-binding protein [Roseiflexaceae bacterium]